jgi:hypothetical protein
MPIRWLPALVAFAAWASAAVASAQTVYVRNAPPGATIELVVNSTNLPAATADANGDATVPVRLPGSAIETDVHVYAEACGNVRRILLVERGLQPPTSAQPCDRRDVFGFFVLRFGTSLVVDLEHPDPAVLIRQGPPPASWFARGEAAEPSHWTGAPPPKGLVLSAGLGFAASGGAQDIVCGAVAECVSNDFNPALSLGATFWIKKAFGVEIGVLRPNDVTGSGNGDHFRFNTTRQARLLTLGGNIGVSSGPARIYGRGGADYHGATLSTNETIDDVTITAADGTTSIAKGGSQSFELKTAGWGWYAGGGVEIWLKPYAGFYAEGTRIKLHGDALGGAEGSTNEFVTSVIVGVRFHVGR